LLTDREAEHVPGCNMAFRKAALEAIGGFDARFRTAGDDVDVCWRLRERGWSLGFHPSAMVWHHRRDSVRAYWRQQVGYGRAEALLERKWPEKYNSAGHLTWAGRLYGSGVTRALDWRRGRIYHGTWGSAPFQSIYQPAAGFLSSLVLMPEWYLVLLGLAMLACFGRLWPPLLLALPVLAVGVGASIAQAGSSAARTSSRGGARSPFARFKLRFLTATLHLLQPLARLCGRLRHGLYPLPWRGASGLSWPRPSTTTLWSERWRAAEDWLESVEAALSAHGARVLRGGAYDRWDLEIRGGLLGAARLRMALEEHGSGRQLLRFRTSPRLRPRGLLFALLFAVLSVGAALDQARAAATILGLFSAILAVRIVYECAVAEASLVRALDSTRRDVS
jgi:O-antigen biosynthesis protein